jgi:hypothetical protein
MKYKNLKMTHRDRTAGKTFRHLQIQPQRNELTKFAKKKKKKKKRKTTQTKKKKKAEKSKVPLVRALIKPARLPLKSWKTSSTVLGIGCGIPSIHYLSISVSLSLRVSIFNSIPQIQSESKNADILG